MTSTRHAAAVRLARRERHAELAEARAELAGWPGRLRVELAERRVLAAQGLAEGVRHLAEDAERYLDRADRAALRRFPERLAVAAGELADRTAAGLAASFAGLRAALGAGPADRTAPGPSASGPSPWGSSPPGPPSSGPPSSGPPSAGPPVLPPVPPVRRGGVEDQVLVLVGASGGLGVGRLALAWEQGWPAQVAEVGVPLSVGLGVAAAAWIVRARRVVVERARLRRWAAGALAELRAGVDAACTARARAELGELAPVVERAVTVRLAVLDAEADR